MNIDDGSPQEYLADLKKQINSLTSQSSDLSNKATMYQEKADQHFLDNKEEEAQEYLKQAGETQAQSAEVMGQAKDLVADFHAKLKEGYLREKASNQQ